MKNRWLIVILITYLILYFFNLDKYPRIWYDDAVFTNPAYTLLQKGTFGTELLHGWKNIENNTFWMPPVSLLLCYPSFKLFGFGIFQARAVSVLLGLVSLVFTYKIAARLYNDKVAVFSSVLLMFNPVNFWINREVRPEAALVAFLLIAIYSFIIAQSSNLKKYYFLSGIFASLGLLSHPNGLHGILAITLIMLIKKIHDGRLWSFILGVILPGLVYLIYVLSDFNNFTAQFTENIGHSGTSILQNIIQEYTRYQSYIGIYGQGLLENDMLLYIKTAFFVILLCLLFFYAAKSYKESDKLVMALVFTYMVMFTILVSQKIWWYLGIIMPFISILMASVFLETQRSKVFKSFKILVIAFLVLNIMHISFSLYITRDYDYDNTTMELKKIIPQGSAIIGPAELWLGMPEYRFYDFAAIFMRMKEEEFPDIMVDLDPDFIIVHENLRSPLVSSYTADFRNDFFNYIDNKSIKIASLPYRSSLTSTTPLEIFEVVKN